MSKRNAPLRRPFPLPAYSVRLAAHSLEGGRWSIPARSCRVPATDAQHAAEIVVREAHSALDLPCWRPLVAESLQHARVVAT
jgi:hypothetical protein